MRRGLLLLALGFTACSSEPDQLLVELTVAKQVQKTDGSTCYALCKESKLPRKKLGLESSFCTDTDKASCEVVGGETTLRIVADFGDVPFDHPEQLSASLTALLDGKVLSTTTMRTEVAPVPYAFALFAVPAASGRLRFDVDAGNGNASALDGLSVAKPVFRVSIPGCTAGAPCSRTALVGAQALTIDAPVNIDPQNALVDTFVDDVPNLTSVSIPLAAIGGGRRAGSFSFDVPASGALWRLRAHVGDQVLDEQLIKLVTPSIDVTVDECSGSSCAAVAASSPVTVHVRAPLNLRTLDADISMRVDGIEQDKITPVKLAECPGTPDGRSPAECKTLQVTAPPAPAKQFQIFAKIGIYQGFSSAIQIAP